MSQRMELNGNEDTAYRVPSSMQVYTVKDTSSTTTWLPDACSSIVSSVCMSFQSRAQDVWLKGHRCEERAAIFFTPFVLQAQDGLISLSRNRASSLMLGASGITDEMKRCS